MKEIVAVILVLTLFTVGCVGNGNEAQESKEPPSSSPAAPSEQMLGEVLTPMYTDKMWARHTVISGNQRKNLLLKLFEEETKDILEVEFSGQEEQSILQSWYSKSEESPLTGELLKYALEMEGIVYCKEAEAPFFPPRPEEYASQTVLREATYTTPTGKSVEAFVVTDGVKEYWFSSEVPFSLVTIRTNGVEILILDDFGFDAEKKISQEKVEDCQPMETPPETKPAP